MTIPALPLPTYLPIRAAAKKYGVSVARIRSLITDGTIRAAMMEKTLVISESDVQATAQTREDTPEWETEFNQYKGVGISIGVASRSFGVQHSTISRWVKSGLIKRLGKDKNRVLIDKADVAYCSKIHKERKSKQGRRLFDKNGLPYKPKSQGKSINK